MVALLTRRAGTPLACAPEELRGRAGYVNAMSAIFGIVHFDGQPVAEGDLNLMSAALAVHGPDGNGVWLEGRVGLGQRLARFTPEDCFERQPAVDAEGQRVLVSDARIDNRPELMEELGIPPAEARELPDSAFILRAYDKWGADCARHLVGAFVFALHDLKERSVLIVRSPLGERALFYHDPVSVDSTPPNDIESHADSLLTAVHGECFVPEISRHHNNKAGHRLDPALLPRAPHSRLVRSRVADPQPANPTI